MAINYELFEDLEKLDPSLAEALSATRKAGLHQQAAVLARHLFSDSMVPKMGNKMAYQDFLTRHGNDGVHTHVDMNDFGQINKYHGEKMGDEAIKQFGNHAAAVSRMFGGKAFRNGGDEFKFWFPTSEHAHGFARELRSRLEKHPAIGGTHNLAASIGIGYNPDHAEGALLNAKKQLGPTDPLTGKRQNAHAIGKAPTVIHSAMHEDPPDGWKKGRGEKGPTASSPKIFQHGLSLHNPLMRSEEDVGFLEKKTPPTFPGLGLGDNRRETPIVSDPMTVNTQHRLMVHARAKEDYPADKRAQWEREDVSDLNNQYVKGRTVAHPDRAISYARANFGGNHETPTTDMSTKMHEDFHLMMNRVEKKYGIQGRNKVLKTLLDSLPTQQRKMVGYNYLSAKSNHTENHEEYIAHLINYLNDPARRAITHKKLQLNQQKADKYHKLMNQAYRQIMVTAKTLVPEHLSDT